MVFAVDVAGAATFDVAFDLAGAATFEVVCEFAGAATVAVAFEVVVAFDLAGAATVDVVFEVAVAFAFELAVDLPRHMTLPHFPTARRIRLMTCLSRRRVGHQTRLAVGKCGDREAAAASAVAFSLVTFFWRSKRK
ncbi:hypothetical protein ACVBEF_12645 [Glaciimonas sp. GG7]